MDNYQSFLIVTGALAKLAIIAMLLERGLAVIFEFEWFVRLTTKEIPDPSDSTKTIQTSRVPGLKSIIALLGSYTICSNYKFDVLSKVFDPMTETTNVDQLGVMLTSLIVAGGSAGAILIFQGYLNLSKQGRDAVVEAKRAESAKQAAAAGN